MDIFYFTCMFSIRLIPTPAPAGRGYDLAKAYRLIKLHEIFYSCINSPKAVLSPPGRGRGGFRQQLIMHKKSTAS